MKYIALCLLLIAAPVGSQSTLPPIPVNIVCHRASCAVEFWGRGSGIRIETKSRAEAEKLAAILVENSGRAYAFEPRFWRRPK